MEPSFFLSLIVKKYDMTIKVFIIFCVVFRSPPAAPIGLWTLSPRFLRGFTPP